MIVGSTFWQELALRFGDLRGEALQLSRRPLAANYHPDGWNHDLAAPPAVQRWYLNHGTRQTIEQFKSIAAVSAVALGSPNTETAWVDWLDCLRRESVDFQAGVLSVSSRRPEWRPDPDAEVGAIGLTLAPVEVHPDADTSITSSDIGEIDDVCGASERVCRRLADDALKNELTHPAQAEQCSDTATASANESKTATVPDASRTLTLREAGRLLRTSVDTLQRLRRCGQIEMFKVGSRWRVKASEVTRLRDQPRFKNG